MSESTPETVGSPRTRRPLPVSFWWAAGSLVAMVVGAFGPWARVLGFITVHGTDGGADGWLVIGAAALAAVMLFLHTRAPARWQLVVSLLAGLAGASIAGYDIIDISSVASGPFGSAIIETGWGIYVALIGSLSLAAASIVLMRETKRARALPAPG
jgi:hypothetical protein